jgi:dihydrofolate reductase
MAKLIYSALSSLDGYVADEHGNFDWAEPDEEVHTLVNDLERGVGTYLYGRRLYETMKAWETIGWADEPLYMREYAEIWRKAEKIVYSSTLQSAVTARTLIERRFDVNAVGRLKEEADRDLAIGGPTLAALAFKAGLIDDCNLFLAPVVVGSGLRCFPDNVRLDLELLDERRFRSGFVYLRYHARGGELVRLPTRM